MVLKVLHLSWVLCFISCSVFITPTKAAYPIPNWLMRRSPGFHHSMSDSMGQGGPSGVPHIPAFQAQTDMSTPDSSHSPRSKAGTYINRRSVSSHTRLSPLANALETLGGHDGSKFEGVLDLPAHTLDINDLEHLGINEDDILHGEIPVDKSSREWKLAVLTYLLNMKAQEHKLPTREAEGKALEDIPEVSEHRNKNVVCKVSPYRVCYQMGQDGKLRPLRRQAQPMNIVRVY